MLYDTLNVLLPYLAYLVVFHFALKFSMRFLRGDAILHFERKKPDSDDSDSHKDFIQLN